MSVTSGFSRSRRLTKTDEFSSVFVFKCSARGNYFQLMARPNFLDLSRLGVVVGKKTAKRASDRNYMKRVVRETFRLTGQSIAGLDIVVRVHTPFDKKNFAPVREELEALLAKANKCLTRLSS